MMQPTPTLNPRLVVDRGHDALAFYQAAFDAEVLSLHEEAGRIVNADLKIGTDEYAAAFSVTEEDGSLNFSPTSLNGTPVLLSLETADPDATTRAFVDAGGEVVIDIDDRPYGRRDGRLRDPFGHLWIPGRWL